MTLGKLFTRESIRMLQASWNDQLGNKMHQNKENQKAPTMMDEPKMRKNANSMQQGGTYPY